MAQREQVLDRAQRLQQAFVNGALRKQARHRLGLYSRSIGLFKRRSYRNSPNVTVLMYRHLPVASAAKSPWPKCSSTSKRGAGIDRGPRFVSLDEFIKASIAACSPLEARYLNSHSTKASIVFRLRWKSKSLQILLTFS